MPSVDRSSLARLASLEQNGPPLQRLSQGTVEELQNGTKLAVLPSPASNVFSLVPHWVRRLD